MLVKGWTKYLSRVKFSNLGQNDSKYETLYKSKHYHEEKRQTDKFLVKMNRYRRRERKKERKKEGESEDTNGKMISQESGEDPPTPRVVLKQCNLK